MNRSEARKLMFVARYGSADHITKLWNRPDASENLWVNDARYETLSNRNFNNDHLDLIPHDMKYGGSKVIDDAKTILRTRVQPK